MIYRIYSLEESRLTQDDERCKEMEIVCAIILALHRHATRALLPSCFLYTIGVHCGIWLLPLGTK